MDFSGDSKDNSGKQAKVLVQHRNTETIANEEKIKLSRMPKLIFILMILFTIVTSSLSLLASVTNNDNNILYFLTFLIYGLDSILLISLKTVDQPHEYVITCFGRFYALWGPGLHIMIPGITKIKSKVSVSTDIPLTLFRDENEPLVVQDGIEIKPNITVILKIFDPYKTVYGVTAHENFINDLKKLGIVYSEYEEYYYAIEELLDSIVRKYLSPLGVEDILELRTSKKGEAGAIIYEDIRNGIENEADIALASYGIDFVKAMFAEIKITDPEVLKKLRGKFNAKQDKEIAELDALTQEAKVKVFEQKAFQTREDGKGAGYSDEERFSVLIKQGLSPEDASKYLRTVLWTKAAEGGANLQIFSMKGGGDSDSFVKEGIGMGIGQNMANGGKKKEKPETTEKEKESETKEEKSD